MKAKFLGQGFAIPHNDIVNVTIINEKLVYIESETGYGGIFPDHFVEIIGGKHEISRKET